MAADRGFFKQEGLNVEHVPFLMRDAPQTTAAITARKLGWTPVKLT